MCNIKKKYNLNTNIRPVICFVTFRIENTSVYPSDELTKTLIRRCETGFTSKDKNVINNVQSQLKTLRKEKEIFINKKY